MASTDVANLSATSATVDDVKEPVELPVQEATKISAVVASSEKLEARSAEASPLSLSPGSSSTPLGAASTNGATHVSGNAPILTAPHPKRFTSSNINKKFLEKASTTPSSTQPSIAASAKLGSAVQKPVLQTASSHSRLVTAKLTATPQPSATAGPGWSRPSSAVPSAAPTPSSAAQKPATSHNVAQASSAPHPAPLGKVIQPQPRAPDLATSTNRLAGKSAWGNLQLSAATAAVKLDAVATDFPTAAEVAQGRAESALARAQADDMAEAQKQALTAEEDTFRGVHLDPNAHHWDEMDEEDDNFLGGVIEFGDGRQYKIMPTDSGKSSPPHAPRELSANDDPKSVGQSENGPPDQLVSKEERFADDFDRSWPRNTLHTNFSPSAREQYGNGLASASSSHSHQSLLESKALFNERSNKLEPYSHPPPRHAGPGAPPFMTRQGSRSDHGVSPEPRFTRDLPPHRAPVQLLQKGPDHRPPGDQPGRLPFDSTGPRDGDAPRRDSAHPFPNSMQRTYSQRPQEPMASPSNWAGSANASRHASHFTRDMPSESHPGRSPIAPAARSSTTETSREDGRQLPPHLSETRRARSPASTSSPLEPVAPPQLSPSESARSPELQTPAPLPASSGPSRSPAAEKSPLPDLEEVQKAAMHSAVERARLRRQQQEEEREKERERARKKAEEIVERINAAKQAQSPATQAETETMEQDAQAEAVKIIEDALQGVQSAQPARPHVAGPSEGRPSQFAGGAVPTAAEVPHLLRADSWRRPAAARAPSDIPAIPAPPFLTEMESLVSPDETLEVVDFSDLGKFAGVEEPAGPQHAAQRPHVPVRVRRSVASDFFEDHEAPAQVQVPSEEVGSWRRRAAQPPPEGPQEAAMLRGGSDARQPQVPVHVPASSASEVTESQRPGDETSHIPAISTHFASAHAPQRSPVTPAYRQAPMSTLNDTLLRIKGALDGMHTEPDPAKPQKWLPPALRPKSANLMIGTPTEVFDRTGIEPPRSPKPAWSNFFVRLPQSQPSRPPVADKQVKLSRTDSLVQRNVYCWYSPMSWTKQDPTFADLLFGRPHIVRGHPRYRVSLPRANRLHDSSVRIKSQATAGPVVNLPSMAARTVGGESSSDSLKPSRSAVIVANNVDAQRSSQLDTTSRSPPPDDPVQKYAGSTSAKGDDASPASNGIVSKSRPQPKLPAGSDVYFYRSHEESASRATKTVNFIVTSELEEENPSEAIVNDAQIKAASSSKPPIGGFVTPTIASSKTEAVSPEISARNTTPPASQTSIWSRSPGSYPSKDSPARLPDPEHLKAVWSHASNKAALPSTNSLEGIADDLTTVPFTLQEVKSEDGETPPLSGSGPPSRMSLHEVTRAFQQVPSPPGSAGHRVAALPSLATSSNGMASRPPSYPYSTAVGNMRPAYPAYPSPMMSSPSPTMMYPPQMVPSPVPRPMVVNGPSSPYMQPVWVPSTPSGVVRPLTSPYHPAQLVPYPSPGGAVPVYGPPASVMQNGSPQVNGVPNRGMTSPQMSQPHALYAGSPVLMQPMPPGPYPGAMTPGRPQARSAYDPHAQHMSMMTPPMSNVPHSPYPPVPLNPYAPRPTW